VYTILPPQAQEWGREQGIQELPLSEPSAVSRFRQTKVELSANPKSRIPVPHASGGQNQEFIMMVGPDAGSVYQLDAAQPRESQRIVVSAVAGDGVTLVELILYVDGHPLARFGAPPYRVMWQLEAGEHRFWAEGIDAGGNQIVSNEVRVSVKE
jgi:hypothetical protein